MGRPLSSPPLSREDTSFQLLHSTTRFPHHHTQPQHVSLLLNHYINSNHTLTHINQNPKIIFFFKENYKHETWSVLDLRFLVYIPQDPSLTNKKLTLFFIFLWWVARTLLVINHWVFKIKLVVSQRKGELMWPTCIFIIRGGEQRKSEGTWIRTQLYLTKEERKDDERGSPQVLKETKEKEKGWAFAALHLTNTSSISF